VTAMTSVNWDRQTCWHRPNESFAGADFNPLYWRRMSEQLYRPHEMRCTEAATHIGIIGGVYDLRDKRTANHMIEVGSQVEGLMGEPVVLIIIDTLSRALRGGDENSPNIG